MTSEKFTKIELKVNECFLNHFSKNNNIKICKVKSEQEITYKNLNLTNNVWDRNDAFFSGLFDELHSFVKNDSVFKTIVFNSWLGSDLAAEFLVVTIIKSFLLTSVNSSNSSCSNGYVYRRDVLECFKNLSPVFRFLIDFDSVLKVFKRCILLMMEKSWVDTYVEKSFSKSGKFSSKPKVRFRISYNFPLYSRINLNISLVPRQLLADDYTIGASISSLEFIFKRSNFQLSKNYFDSSPLIKLSSQAFKLDNEVFHRASDISLKMWGEYDKTHKFRDLSQDLKEYQESFGTMVKIIKSKLLKLKSMTNWDGSPELTRDISIVFSKFRVELSGLFKYYEFIVPSSSLDSVKKHGELKSMSPLNLEKMIRNQVDDLKSIKFNLKSNLKKISEADKEKRLILDLVSLDYLKSLGLDEFYFSYYFDFRGRIYSHSNVHPMNNKLSRASLNLRYDDSDYSRLIKSKFFEEFNRESHGNLSFVCCSKLVVLDSKTDPLKSFLIRLYLLEIGKLNKSSLLGEGSEVELNSFIGEGIRIISGVKLLEAFDPYDYLHVIKYEGAILKANNGDFSPILILKDATCSSLMHWAYLLKTSEYSVAKNFNFCSNTWNDTYTVIIKLFLNRHSDVPSIVSQLFNRKNLKRSIMTTNYNVSFYSFYRYFFASLKDGGLDLSISLDEFTLVMYWLKLLYNFVLVDLFDILFDSSKSNLIKSLDTGRVNVGGTIINLSYLKSYDGPRDSTKLKLKGSSKYSRITFVTKLLLNEEDKKQTNIALEPNLIQAYDANLCRKTAVKTRLAFPIHDCFGVATLDLGCLADYQVGYFRDEFLKHCLKDKRCEIKRWYSIFILL